MNNNLIVIAVSYRHFSFYSAVELNYFRFYIKILYLELALNDNYCT